MRDIDIRKSLHNYYLQEFHNDFKVVDELKICGGKSIADVSIISFYFHAFEIKSHVDTLQRLDKQIKYYNQVFDFITVVSCINYFDDLYKSIPDFWGIWILYESLEGTKKIEVKKPKKNPFRDPFSIAQLLWRDEAIQLLAKHGLLKGFKNKRNWILWDRLANKIPINRLSNETRELLKERSNWKETKFLL